MREYTIEQVRGMIKVDDSRDSLLTEFGKTTLRDRYLLPGESYQDVFARASVAFSNGDVELAQRLYDYSSKLWFSFATPLISNGGTNKGLPISCFLNYVEDSLTGLVENFAENAFLSTRGGGIGSYWGDVRSIGEVTSKNIETPGVIPFMHCIDSQMLAYHQGNTRRGAAAVYLDIDHPEILDFIAMRSSTGGDVHRKNENLHHGIGVSDAFMRAVEEDENWELIDPNSGNVHESMKARTLWIKILQTRLETGEPYLFFKDTTNKALPQTQKDLGLVVHHSNLCTEITLPTNKERTAVCCLSSINVAKYEEWRGERAVFISDLITMLDNTLQVFITNAPPQFKKAIYSAARERSLGLGAMGFHTYLQQQGMNIEGEEAKEFNELLFRDIKMYAREQSQNLAKMRGEPADMWNTGLRNAHLLSVAPNATSSIICGGVSPGIEPMAANSFAQKTKSGTHEVRNPALETLLRDKYQMNTEEVWSSISTNGGSVSHLEFLTDNEREVFKTAVEIDQFKLIDLAADRQAYICQAQSFNIFFQPDVHVSVLQKAHFAAWRKGLKSMYYLRSDAQKGTEKINGKVKRKVREEVKAPPVCTAEVCTSCEG